MRAGDHPQRSIVRFAIIQMQPQRDHAFKESCRRLRVPDSLLQSPAGKALNVVSFPNRDAQILMPADVPVGLWGLVEQQRADGESRTTGGGRDDFKARDLLGYSQDRTFSQQITSSRPAAGGVTLHGFQEIHRVRATDASEKFAIRSKPFCSTAVMSNSTIPGPVRDRNPCRTRPDIHAGWPAHESHQADNRRSDECGREPTTEFGWWPRTY